MRGPGRVWFVASGSGTAVLTPSTVTRQIQRLEATLKAPLLDRRVQPGRITREGRAVLDDGQHMLRIMDDLKATGSKKPSQAESSL